MSRKSSLLSFSLYIYIVDGMREFFIRRDYGYGEKERAKDREREIDRQNGAKDPREIALHSIRIRCPTVSTALFFVLYS